MYHKRCIVCNKVSSEEIETNVGDTLNHVFFNDTISQGWICFECDNWTEILRLEYYIDDEDEPLPLHGLIEYEIDLDNAKGLSFLFNNDNEMTDET